MVFLAYTIFLLSFVPDCHLFSYSILPNLQKSNSISHNSQSESPYPSEQGLRPTPNTTDSAYLPRASESKPAYTNEQPAYPNPRPHKAPGNTPSSSYYSQYNPAVLYINPPYTGQGPSYPPTQYANQPSEPPKSGIWDWFSFITWPKTWLFGSSENQSAPGNQYSVLHNPNRPFVYNQPPYYQSPAPPAPAGYVPNAPQGPLSHHQGLYQVPAPNSKFAFVPITGKYPTYFPKQPQQNGGSEHLLSGYGLKANQSKPYFPTSKSQPVEPSTNPAYPSTAQPSYSTPKLITPVEVSPSETDENTAPKNTYNSLQHAYSVYLVPSKPIFTPPSTSFGYPLPQTPQFPVTFRYPPYGVPNAPAQPYYQDPVPAYGDFGYPQRYPYFNGPQASDAAYPKYPATVKPDCCTTPKAPLADAETVNAAIAVVPQPDMAVNTTSSATTLTSTTTTTSTETANITVTDASLNSTTTSPPDHKPQARHFVF